jgi:hypothetical protein
MRKIGLAAIIATTAFVVASAQTHPNLDGTWYLDKAHSQYPAESATEEIHHHGDAIDITLTEKMPGRPINPMQLHLIADGKATASTVGPNKFTSTTHWDDGKLVTFVEGDRGQHMTEIRQLSSDGNTLTVTGYHQDELKKPYYVRVMTKHEP